MGTWSLWHFALFIIVAAAGRLRARPNGGQDGGAGPSGYGGWLAVLSLFLVFWAAQELGEFYRVRDQLQVLMPSASHDPEYVSYMHYAWMLAWIEALILLACALILMGVRASWARQTVIAGLWLAGPIAAATELVMAESYFGDYIVEHDYSALAATILFATTWTCYLLTSKRARNTYASTAAQALPAR